MLEYDFLNVLRLDGCFRFLNLGYRIHLHQAQLSQTYFENLEPDIQEKILKMKNTLQYMAWLIPQFHSMRETEDAIKYYVFANARGEISERGYADMYQEEFEIFKQKVL